MNWHQRWRSKGVWISLSALLLFILKNYGLLNFMGLNADSYRELSDLFLAFLTAWGIFNNPLDRDNF